MSRKSKRQSQRAGGSASTPAATDNPVLTKSSGPSTDYSYVIKDLRRIGILAGSFIIVLIVLSFFLR